MALRDMKFILEMAITSLLIFSTRKEQKEKEPICHKP